MKVILIKFTVRRLASDGVCVLIESDIGEVPAEKCYATQHSPLDGKCMQTFAKHVEKKALLKRRVNHCQLD